MEHVNFFDRGGNRDIYHLDLHIRFDEFLTGPRKPAQHAPVSRNILAML